MYTLKAPASPVTFWLSVLVVGLVTGLGIQFAVAWQEPNPSVPPPDGNVAGPITTQGNQTKNGKLYVKSTADVPNFPATWGGGVASYDFYADRGSFGAGYDGSLNFQANRDGYVGGVSMVASAGMHTPALCLKGDCRDAWPAASVTGYSGLKQTGQEQVVKHTYLDIGYYKFCALGMVQVQAKGWVGCEVYQPFAGFWKIRVSTYISDGVGAYCYANCIN